MGVDRPTIKQDWITGSPWGDLRAHARLESEGSERVIDVHGLLVVGRSPEWALSTEGYAEFRVPCTRTELNRLPVTSAQIMINSYFSSGRPGIRLVCSARELEEVFLRFCESLIVELSEGRGATEALALVLGRFRRLFEQHGEPISTERVIGLFAELVILDRLLDFGIDAVPGWLGPIGETHDFVFGSTHLEVKTLRASGGRSFRVSNIEQLNTPEGTQLFLVGVRVAPGDQTVGAMVERIRSRIPTNRDGELKAVLKLLGYQYPVDPEWNKKRFSVREPEVWLVDSTFPRLVSSMLPGAALPVGVSDVQYTVSLENVAANSLSMPSIVRAIQDSKRS